MPEGVKDEACSKLFNISKNVLTLRMVDGVQFNEKLTFQGKSSQYFPKSQEKNKSLF